MRKTAFFAALFAALVCASGGTAFGGGSRETADALWGAREDLSKAGEAVLAYEALLKENPKDYETLLRLSRLHYWIGQNLEPTSSKEAISHYNKGREYGKTAASTAPDRPGGYFFEGANLARENNLKGTLSNLYGIRMVKKMNEKVARIEPAYFHGGPDRFFCAYYTKLPGILGGDLSMAVAYGRKAVGVQPAYAGNHVFLAEAYRKEGNSDLARKELEAALAIPDNALPDAIPEQRLEKRRAAALLKKISH
ncbi:MAG: TRAP transporter TatT component family protein [Deltaproteobacteria bacterium]|nr:TRAP transporter TatT component family protein [Candidatus Deferrimicrobiaceae bacterium]